MKLALATTVYNINCLPTWLQHHGRLVDRIFLFQDGSCDLPNHPKLKIIPGSQESSFPGPSGVMQRQVQNLRRALVLCKEEGIDWLFNIDDDELIYAEDSLHEFFQSVPTVTSGLGFRLPSTWQER